MDDRPDPRATAVIATPAFTELVRSRRRFVVPATIVGFGAYLAIIVVSGFTDVLSGPALGVVSWTFVLTVLVFPLVWLLTGLYVRRAQHWDELADRAFAEASVDAGSSVR
ncbi:uncharacterized membrane protein (DUF485 family) [Actinomycetospora succinea]|uniref:Uncharacterized membrane protein (DUF485 family) n=1 Tax=Actinomycetospora succinea TaxID=663603 RepID=A0A4R6UUT3_9PSEU|nr:DUF485 domain-containing protein [Actinomycetospora succinea]TDQ50952.1 uncharacterized membrane protein (DUF485 family) [Actinomycetospora succinea]